MTRQPSTRTAEPRTDHDPNTAAGRLEVFIRANANRGGMNDLAGWLSDLDKIVAEAAAPAELDVLQRLVDAVGQHTVTAVRLAQGTITVEKYDAATREMLDAANAGHDVLVRHRGER